MKEQKLFLKMEISISPFQTPKPGNFLNKSFYLIFLLQYFIPNMLRSSSARDPPALAGRLARARLIDSPPGSRSGSAAQVHLLPLFFSKLTKKKLSLLSDSLLPGGDDWASGGAICPVFAQPFAGDERILHVCPPLLFLLLCETEHPKP